MSDQDRKSLIKFGSTAPRLIKHRQVYQHLLAEIESGRLKDGDRLPSEAELVTRFARQY